MKKKRYVAKALVLSIFISVFSILTVLAAYEKYTTTINMASGTTLYGVERNMPYKNHRITITPTELRFSTTDNIVTLNIDLQHKALFGWESMGNTDRQFTEVGQTKGVLWTNKKSGKTRYVFNTGDYGNRTGAIKADPVYIWNLDQV